MYTYPTRLKVLLPAISLPYFHFTHLVFLARLIYKDFIQRNVPFVCSSAVIPVLIHPSFVLIAAVLNSKLETTLGPFTTSYDSEDQPLVADAGKSRSNLHRLDKYRP